MSPIAIEVGTAYISILPSTSKLAPAIRKELGGVERQYGRSGSRTGRTFAAGLMKGARRVVGAAGLAAAIVGGATLKGGISRLLDIDTARGQLRGLGHDAKTIEKIMGNALASVKGTAFGLGEAAKTASTAVAAGIKPGKQLEKYLKGVADAAAIANAPMDEMGSIFNRVQTQGRAYTMELNMLADRGLPIFAWLQKEYGVTAQELRKMVAAGKVDAVTFRKVIEENIGGAAMASGSTIRGAFRNVMAALSRVGANFLEGLGFNGLAPLLKRISGGLGPVEDAASKAGNTVRRVLVPAFGAIADIAGGVVDAFRGIRGGGGEVSKTLKSLGDFVGGLVPVVRNFVSEFKDAAGPAFRSLAASVKDDLLPTFREILPILRPVVAFILRTIGSAVVGAFKGAVQAINGLVDVIVGTFRLFKSVITGDWDAAWKAVKQIAGGAWDAIAGAFKVWLNIGIIAFLRRGVLNLLKMWRKGWSGLAQVVGGTFRAVNRLVGGLWKALGAIFRTMIRFIGGALSKAFTAWWKVVRGVMRLVGNGIRAAWRGVIRPAFQGVRDILTKVVAPAFRKMWDRVRPIVRGLGTAIRGVWQNVVRPVFSAMHDFVSKTLVAGFRKGVRAIKTLWDTVKSAATAPVRFVIKTIWNNGLVKLINRIPFIGKKVGPIDVGFARGGYTGRGGKYQPAGIVHADEFVVRKEARARFERENPGALDFLNRTGKLPGYAKGGKVVVWPLPGGTASTYAGHDGVDLNAPNDNGKPFFAAAEGVVSHAGYGRGYGQAIFTKGWYGELVYGHASRVHVSPGMVVQPGQVIGNVGSTGNSTGPHLHFGFPGGTYGQAMAFLKGAKAPGGEAAPGVEQMQEIVKAAKRIWRNFQKMESGLIRTMTRGVLGRAKSWINDKVPGPGPIPGGIFDRGGILEPGSIALNASRRPEAVFTHKQFASLVEGELSRGRRSELVITNWHEGRGYINEVADEAIDNFDRFAGTTARMGGARL